jgi:hypothetical protein
MEFIAAALRSDLDPVDLLGRGDPTLLSGSD